MPSNPQPYHRPDRPRVLVVDDETGLQHACERVLAQHAEVVVVGDGRGARDACAAAPFDLALVDVRLPDTDGFALMAELQAACPRLDVVVMTASVHDMDRKLLRSLREHAFLFLPKPFGRELLLTVFDRWREMRELAAREQAHRERVDRELREARSYQAALLPPRAALLDGLAIHAWFQSCEELSGDLYDYTSTDDEQHVALMVADVAGHGVGAAMLSGLLKGAFRDARERDFEPGAVLEYVQDALLLAGGDERFVTLAVARITPSTGQLRYASAGHADSLLRRDSGEIAILPETGPLLHAGFRGDGWNVVEHEIGPDDQLLMLTDGLEETPNGSGERFGSARLQAAFRQGTRGLPLLSGIADAVDRHRGGRPADDDHTMLLARIV